MNFEDIPLRGMQMPEPVSWWPLAFGWWLLLATLIVLPVLYLFYRNWQAARLASISERHLAQIADTFAREANGQLLAFSLSQWFRQVVLSLYSREQVASVTGESWLQLLDRLGNCQDFTQGEGRELFNAVYSNAPLQQPQQMLALAKQWGRYATRHPVKGALI